MNARKLTPYDRGTRLEPQLWPLGDDPDSYGRVDFDNDESATVLTAYAVFFLLIALRRTRKRLEG